MRGRDFLDVARELVDMGSEAHWRSAAGRAYYAVFLECRSMLEHWGFVNNRQDQAHPSVRRRFLFTQNADLVSIGLALERLSELRNHADYDLSTPGRRFVSDSQTRKAIADADRSIDLLDRIDADPTLRASAIQAIQAGPP